MATPHVLIGERGYFAATRSTLYESFLYEIWLVYLLYRAGILAKSGGYCRETDRAATEFIDNGA